MSDVSEKDFLVLAYLKWHYGRGLKELFGVFGNFLWFVSNFFSFKLLLKTLFAPWKRLGESYGSIFDFENFASSFVINLLMRLVGFITKTIVIIVGAVAYVFTCLLLFLAIIFWILAPVFLVACVALSVLFFIH